MKKAAIALATILTLLAGSEVNAQGRRSRSRGDSGERGRDRGFGRDRGRDSGDSGGDRRSRFGGPRGGFGGSSQRGFGGGPPSGGFGGRSSSGGRGFPGGSGGFDMSQMASRMSRFMDRNGDGTIDQSEISRFPQSMRDRMGLSDVKSISVEDFSKKATARFEERMKQRSEESGRDSGSRSSRSSSGAFKQRERKKMLPDMPDEFVEGDADEDGQIALYEWAAWRRSEMAAFFEMDTNQDAFLTPSEIIAAKEEETGGAAYKRERLSVSGSSSSSGKSGSSSRMRIAASRDSGSSRSSSSTRSSSSSSRSSWGDRDRSSSDRGRSSWGDRGSSSRGSWGDRGSSSRSSWGSRGSSDRGRDRSDRSR